MKRSLIILVSLILLIQIPVLSQGRFLKNVAKDVKNDLLGTSGSQTNTQPEPSCACKDAIQVFGLSQYNIVYNEVTIELLDDGSFLVFDRISEDYYLIKDGTRKGPLQEDDPVLVAYKGSGESTQNPLLLRYKEYISAQGDKYIIKFDGKTYGPYARVDNFAVTKSKDKFAATVVENIVVTESDGEKMEAAIKNAKTEAEKMELAMQYSQQMSRKIIAAGGAEGTSAKLVTNIEGTTYNPMLTPPYNSNMKYDELVYTNMENIMDLKGNKVITLKREHIGLPDIYIKSDNSGYASYNSGTLTMSDGKILSDLFNLLHVKSDGKIWLSYMYYSPAKNAIMRCKIPF